MIMMTMVVTMMMTSEATMVMSYCGPGQTAESQAKQIAHNSETDQHSINERRTLQTSYQGWWTQPQLVHV